MHKLAIHPATLPHLPFKNALLKPLRGAQSFFRALAACLLARPCNKPFLAPNSNVSVCLASLCIETTNFRWQHFLLKNVPVVMFLMEYYPLACFIFLSALWNISCEINASTGPGGRPPTSTLPSSRFQGHESSQHLGSSISRETDFLNDMDQALLRYVSRTTK